MRHAMDSCRSRRARPPRAPGLRRARWLAAWPLLLLAALPVAAAGPADERLTPAHFSRLLDVSDPQLSPDGNWVAYVVTRADLEADSYVDSLWMTDWDGERTLPLTQGPDSASHPRWSPDGRQLAFLSERGEPSAGTQVWVLDLQGGEARQLTKVSGDVTDHAWSPDARRLALVVAPGEPAPEGESRADAQPRPIVIDRYHFKNDEHGYLDGDTYERIWLYDVESGAAQALTAGGPFDEHGPAWSPDGEQIAFYGNRDADPDRTANTDIWVAPARGGSQPRRLTTFPGQDNGPLAWRPDGGAIAYVQGPEPKYWLYEFSQAAVVPAAGGAAALPAAGLARDTNSPRFTDDGRALELIVTDDRARYLARVPVRGGGIERLSSGNSVVSGFSRAGARLVVLLSEPGVPAELHALERGGPRRLTRHNDAWTGGLRFGAVEGVQFPSTDGTVSVSALITRPPGFGAGRRYPTLLWIHGGPYGQDEYAFDFERQLFAARGYVVVQVNYRGSSGRGPAFAEVLFADWGNKDVADVIAGVDHAIALGIADPERLAVGGWSQGGIITNYVITRDPRFRAAISGAATGNQLAQYGADQYVFMYDNEFGRPWDAPELWIKLSYPFFEADRIRTPTLFLGGDRDFNVPIIGGEQMYQALKSLGVPSRLVVYPGARHSFSRPSYDIDALERYLAWLEEHLATPVP